MEKRVLIIGAGTAGLCAAKTALENHFEATVYEQTKNLGGIWNYNGTHKTGEDENGVAYGYMYQDLRTNVPKELMRFTDFDVNTVKDKSFLNAEEVLQFLHSYADAFDLHRVIKFQHQVIRILPTKDNSWEVIVRDLQSGDYFTELFDFTIICNGHHFHPMWPKIKGRKRFLGTQKHSFDFRTKEEFQDKRVLVVGSGASALDIAVLIGKRAQTVFLAHHIPFRTAVTLAENIILKPDVQEITETGGVFKDGTECTVDAIIFCTGFKYSFPFLSTECGVFVEDNYVQPLFKQVINIRHPTMAIIGLNTLVPAQMHMDIQAQFVIKLWATGRELPSTEDMLKDAQEDLEKRLKRGWKKSHAHKMGDYMPDYYRQLAEFAEIRGMAKVYLKIWQTVGMGIITNYLNYRNDLYAVIDDETFEKFNGGAIERGEDKLTKEIKEGVVKENGTTENVKQ